MDWKLFASTFAAVFVAEMGDKTQLATLSLAGSASSSRWIVFAASALALVTTSAIAVVAGEAVARAVPPIWIRRAAGVIFLVLGVVYIATAGSKDG
jgi:Ca2+/H+ antiporter, TMEM165/GDT1 family